MSDPGLDYTATDPVIDDATFPYSYTFDSGGSTIDESNPTYNYVASGAGLYRPDDSSGTNSPFNVDNALKLLQGGINAYGQIKQIDHGGYSSYQVPGHGLAPPAPSGNLPAPSDGGPPPSSTFMEKLTDFSTPVPYAVGLVTIFGVLMLVKIARS